MADIDTQTQAAFAAANDWSKQILTLSTGILTLTIALGETLFGDLSDKQKLLLWLSWGFYVASMIGSVWALSSLTGTMAKSPAPTASAIYASNNRIPAIAQLVTFIIATVIIVCFGISAVGNEEKPPTNESASALATPR